jgi:macrolide transport system ATP-binding/permease protein
MRTVRAFFKRLAGLRGDPSRDQDLTEEIETNLQLHIDDNLRRGMTPQQARRDAILKLGGLEPAKEAYRDQATIPFVENLARDLRFALRQLSGNPGFTCTATLMLALGMCASVAIFAFVDAALIKPLPYKDSKRLVGVYEKIEGTCPYCNLSYPDYLDWKRQNTVFKSLDAYGHQNFILSTSTGVERAAGARASDGFFRTLGVTPILGRDFRRGEDQLSAPRTVLLNYAEWQQRYGGSKDVLGKTVILDGQVNEIIGVLPRDFQFAPAEPADYWSTLHASSECDLRRSCHSLFGIARLKDGVTLQSALADVTGIADRLAQQYPGDNKGQGAALQTMSQVIVGDIRPILCVLLSGACLLLIIAGINIASLLLVRTEGRRRELAVRTSLGASTARIVGQFVAEALVLVCVGTLIGLGGAYLAIHLLNGLLSVNLLAGMPYLRGIGLNQRVIGFACVIALLAAFVFTLTPMARLRRSSMRQGLSEGSRGSAGNTWRRLGSKLVVIELATAMVLLTGAGLLGQSLYRMLTVKIGLQPDHLALTYIATPDAKYTNDAQNVALERNILATVSEIPGVKLSAVASDAPIGFNGDTTWFKIMGRPWHGEHNDTPERDVSTDYFQTLGATLLKGRYFQESDDKSHPNVAIVNQAFTRHYFPGDEVLGKQLSPLADPPVPITIVGVIADVKEGPLNVETVPALYFPFNQNTGHTFNLLFRTSVPETSVVPAITAAMHRIDPGIVVWHTRTMTERINESAAAYLHRLLASLVGAFAALALLLGVLGLYGVVSYSVSQLTREIGVRIALGAERANVYQMILKEAGWLTCSGVAIGVVCAISAANLMQSLLFGVTSWDPATLGSVAILLTAAALMASYVPARRAASVNPVDALRAE